jgi:Protein of unknown function (DUF3592)
MGLFGRMKEAQEQASEAMQNAGGMKGMMGNMGSVMSNPAGQAAYAQLAQKLKASGVEAPGTIVALRDTGDRDMGGGQKTEVDVTISPTGGTPYNTTVKQSFLPAQLEGLSAGHAITVKYDPDNPSAALIYGW